MNILLIISEFVKLVKQDNVISMGTCEFEKELIDELVKDLISRNVNVYFVPTTILQAKHLQDLGQKCVSLNDREIDLAIEFVDQIDQYFNFNKRTTKSFIKDKMISQSALTLVVVSTGYNLVNEITSDISVEISTFAYQRTIINLQSYGLARIVTDHNNNPIRTEIGHYLAKIAVDKNISLEDFEYSVRTIPGVLETGLFLGLADVVYLFDESKNQIKAITRK
jgi:ribose 5-phosphate isomerase A